MNTAAAVITSNAAAGVEVLDSYLDYVPGLDCAQQAKSLRRRGAVRFLERFEDLDAWMTRPAAARLADAARADAWPFVSWLCATGRLHGDVDLIAGRPNGFAPTPTSANIATTTSPIPIDATSSPAHSPTSSRSATTLNNGAGPARPPDTNTSPTPSPDTSAPSTTELDRAEHLDPDGEGRIIAFGMTNWTNYRTRALLYAGRPNWSLLNP